MKNPDYILNVGDNFYWGGIEIDCGSTPMSQISGTARCLVRVVRGLGSVKWVGWIKGGIFVFWLVLRLKGWLDLGWCSDNLAVKMKMIGFAPLYVPTTSTSTTRSTIVLVLVVVLVAVLVVYSYIKVYLVSVQLVSSSLPPRNLPGLKDISSTTSLKEGSCEGERCNNPGGILASWVLGSPRLWPFLVSKPRLGE